MTDDQDGWYERAAVVAGLARSEASEVEMVGGLTDAMLTALRESELFWALLPTQFGGGATDIVTALGVIDMISRADGSVGWTLMANMNAAAVVCAYLPDPALETCFANDRRPIFGGMLAPRGTATPSGELSSSSVRVVSASARNSAAGITTASVIVAAINIGAAVYGGDHDLVGRDDCHRVGRSSNGISKLVSDRLRRRRRRGAVARRPDQQCLRGATAH